MQDQTIDLSNRIHQLQIQLIAKLNQNQLEDMIDIQQKIQCLNQQYEMEKSSGLVENSNDTFTKLHKYEEFIKLKKQLDVLKIQLTKMKQTQNRHIEQDFQISKRHQDIADLWKNKQINQVQQKQKIQFYNRSEFPREKKNNYSTKNRNTTEQAWLPKISNSKRQNQSLNKQKEIVQLKHLQNLCNQKRAESFLEPEDDIMQQLKSTEQSIQQSRNSNKKGKLKQFQQLKVKLLEIKDIEQKIKKLKVQTNEQKQISKLEQQFVAKLQECCLQQTDDLYQQLKQVEKNLETYTLSNKKLKIKQMSIKNEKIEYLIKLKEQIKLQKQKKTRELTNSKQNIPQKLNEQFHMLLQRCNLQVQDDLHSQLQKTQKQLQEFIQNKKLKKSQHHQKYRQDLLKLIEISNQIKSLKNKPQHQQINQYSQLLNQLDLQQTDKLQDQLLSIQSNIKTYTQQNKKLKLESELKKKPKILRLIELKTKVQSINHIPISKQLPNKQIKKQSYAQDQHQKNQQKNLRNQLKKLYEEINFDEEDLPQDQLKKIENQIQKLKQKNKQQKLKQKIIKKQKILSIIRLRKQLKDLEQIEFQANLDKIQNEFNQQLQKSQINEDELQQEIDQLEQQISSKKKKSNKNVENIKKLQKLKQLVNLRNKIETAKKNIKIKNQRVISSKLKEQLQTGMKAYEIKSIKELKEKNQLLKKKILEQRKNAIDKDIDKLQKQKVVYQNLLQKNEKLQKINKNISAINYYSVGSEKNQSKKYVQKIPQYKYNSQIQPFLSFLQNYNFEQAHKVFLSIQKNISQQSLKELKFSLNKTTKLLIENINNKAKNLNVNLHQSFFVQLQQIYKLLSKIELAKKLFIKQPSIFSYFSVKNLSYDDQLINKLKDFSAEIKNVIWRKLQSLQYWIQSAVFSQDFQYIQNIRQILINSIDNINERQLQQFKYKINKKLEQGLRKILYTYRSNGIKYFFENPPKKLLQNLQKGKKFGRKYNEIYNSPYNQIKKFIYEQMQKNIENCSSRNLKYSQKKKQLKLLSTVLNTLPQQFATSFRQNIQQINIKLKPLENSYKQQIINMQNEIIDSLVRDKNVPNIIFASKIIKRFIEKINEFIEFMPELCLVEQKVKNIYENIVKSQIDSFKNIQFNGDSIKQIEFTNINAFMDLKISIEKMNPYYFKDIEESLNQMHKFLETYWTEILEIHHNELKSFNCTGIRKNLHILKRSQTFLVKLSSYLRNHQGKNLLTKNLIIIINQLNYSYRVNEMISKFKSIHRQIIEFTFLKKQFQSQRNQFYSKLNEKLSIIKNLYYLRQHIDESLINSYKKQCVPSIKNKLDQAVNKCFEIFKKANIERSQIDTFNYYYNNLVSFQTKVKQSEFQDLQNKRKAIDRLVQQKLNQYSQICETQFKSIQMVAKNLIQMKFISQNIPLFSDKINLHIDQSIKKFIKSHKREGGRALTTLALILKNDQSGIGRNIIDQHEALKSESISIFNKEILSHDIGYVLQNIQGDQIDKKQLNIQYNKIMESYKNIVEDHLFKYLSLVDKHGFEPILRDLIFDTKNIAQSIKYQQLFQQVLFQQILSMKIKEVIKQMQEKQKQQSQKKELENIDQQIIKVQVKQKLQQQVKSQQKSLNAEEIQLQKLKQLKQKQLQLKLKQKQQKLIQKDQLLRQKIYIQILNQKQAISQLISRIFALWTLKNLQFYQSAAYSNQQERKNYLLQPHPGQIISILRILSTGYKQSVSKNIINNLIQIGTGQGKSVTLAVTTIILGLIGCDVSCACYSKFLSIRDYQSFKSLFEAYGLIDHIHYGTFNQICQNEINERGDIRNRILNIIRDNQLKGKNLKEIKKRPKILLIDEVDVFFNKQFYGNVYTPLVRLRDQTITNLINHIWSVRKVSPRFIDIELRPEYQACINHFKQYQNLIKQAVKDMLADLSNYDHDYIVHNDKIAYKQQDRLVYNVVYGYKTVFAYYHQNQIKKISDASLRQNISIGIKSGVFSYAQIPFNFKRIMGVTGTLKTLSNYERHIINQIYKIKKFTYIPSVFGLNKREFARIHDVLVQNKIDFKTRLIQSIQSSLRKGKRAVLVFFNTQKQLKQVYNSKELISFMRMKSKIQIITQAASFKQRQTLIKTATSAGQITFLTRVFGRGVDFICRDQTVLQNGGVHVICTFFSQEYSQQIQIMGRSARQGQDGSFGMVLLDQDLQKFLGINYKNILIGLRNEKKLYDGLHERRITIFEQRYKQLSDNITLSKKQHTESLYFVEAINNFDFDYIKKYLIQKNRGAQQMINCKMMILMDATGSMSSLLYKAKQNVKIMFERIRQILKNNKYNQDCFKLQFVVYRDYDCGINKILQYSPWETEPINLRNFMNTINAEGGGDYEEAIEIGFWHANQQHIKQAISQVILIADAPAKNFDQIIKYRNHYLGEETWRASKYGAPTHYQIQLQKLKTAKIPVHALYLNTQIQTHFEYIANQTGGGSFYLNVNNDGAQQLTEYVSIKILKHVGQASGKSDELAKKYREKYGSRTHA